MKNLKLIIAVVLFAIVMCGSAYAQTEPTCESMGYTMTQANCTSKSKAALKCPFDSTKVYCGLNACDMVTAVTCSNGCKEYHSTCTSKCKTCYSSFCKSQYNTLNHNYSLVIRRAVNCGNYVSWDGNLMPVSVGETCETFKTRVGKLVTQYNHQCACEGSDPECAPQITSSPSNISCNTCCIKTGDSAPYLSHCTEEDDGGGFLIN